MAIEKNNEFIEEAKVEEEIVEQPEGLPPEIEIEDG